MANQLDRNSIRQKRYLNTELYWALNLATLRYTPIPASFYVASRNRLTKQLKPNSIAIIHSNEEFPTNADGRHAFRQNNDLFYLCGIDQEETVLLLAPDYPDPSLREVLFLKETNETIATWEGQKLNKSEGEHLSCIASVKWTNEFPSIFHQVMTWAEHAYLYQNEYDRKTLAVESIHDRFVHDCQRQFPLHHYHRLAPLVHALRMTKQKEELVSLKEALKVTKLGYDAVVRSLNRGVKEFELEAIFSKVFIENGGGFAYDPIIASGMNACVLHYIDNGQALMSGDLVLMDVGASYGNYNADITRTFPVDGRFSQRQKEVYQAVLDVKNYATDLLKPGLVLKDYQEAVGKFMESELLKLGLLKQEDIDKQSARSPLYKQYFMHGTSHYLGLDVHDVGARYDPIPPGAVLTVEPGIYISEEGIGIRLEDDILVTEEGNVNLSEDFPIEIDHVEDWVNGH